MNYHEAFHEARSHGCVSVDLLLHTFLLVAKNISHPDRKHLRQRAAVSVGVRYTLNLD